MQPVTTCRQSPYLHSAWFPAFRCRCAVAVPLLSVTMNVKGDATVFHKVDEKVVSSCLLQYKPACVIINFGKLRRKLLKRTSLVVVLVLLFFGNHRHA